MSECCLLDSVLYCTLFTRDMFCCEIDIWLNMGTYFSAIKMVLDLLIQSSVCLVKDHPYHSLICPLISPSILLPSRGVTVCA